MGDFIPPTIYENKFFVNSLFLSLVSKSTAVMFDESKNFSYLTLENFLFSSKKFSFSLILFLIFCQKLLDLNFVSLVVSFFLKLILLKFLQVYYFQYFF